MANNLYYLAHGGPGSGRYPLGSGERPYQKYEGSGKRKGGLTGYIRERKAKKEEARVQQAKQEALRRQAEKAQEERRLEADKQRVLRSGTASEVMRYQGRLTNKELEDAYKRLDWESKLISLSQKEVKSNIDKVDEIMKNVQTITGWGKIGTDTYNTIAAIYNASPEGKKKPLTLVNTGGGGGGGKKK